MIHHPLILGPKLVMLALIIVVLMILHAHLTPNQFIVAVCVGAAVFIAFSVALWIVAIRLLANPESKIAKGMVLSHQQRPEDGYSASKNDLKELTGARGTAVSALRPSGTAMFDRQRVSVVAEGQFIPAGSPVEVVVVEGSRIVVREVMEPGE
jgi:membrane-bound serine protease (ClpP class)